MIPLWKEAGELSGGRNTWGQGAVNTNGWHSLRISEVCMLSSISHACVFQPPQRGGEVWIAFPFHTRGSAAWR